MDCRRLLARSADVDWWLLWATLSLSVFSFITCCCGGGPVGPCQFVNESFVRANNTDINTGSSCGWTETAGDAAIASNALTFTTANAKATCSTVNSLGNSLMAIRVFLKSSAASDLIRVGLGDHYAEIKIHSTDAYVRIYDSTSTLLAESQYGEFAAGNLHRLDLCFSGDHIAAFLFDLIGSGRAAVSTPATVTGDSLWLGTGGTVTGTVSFSSLTADQVATGCSSCDDCACDGATHPAQMQVVLSALANGTNVGHCTNCASYAGTYILDQATTACWWRYRFSSAPCTGCSGGDCKYLEVQVNPPAGILTEPYMIVNLGGTSGSGNMAWQQTSLDPSSPFDCSAINVSPTPTTDDNNICKATGSTCDVTAVP
jgi:hypothetical protein